MTEVLIIGGSDAGISAALRARELDPASDVTVVVADAYPNYSICGLPFFLSGETADWHDLAHRKAHDIEAHGIRLRLDHLAHHIDPDTRRVTITDGAGTEHTLSYDELDHRHGRYAHPADHPGPRSTRSPRPAHDAAQLRRPPATRSQPRA